jgi:hypothetical protein
MRRAAVLAIAAGYALSFVVVCLGTCFAAVPSEHACCEGKDGFRETARDCCSVTPSASPSAAVSAGAPPVAIAVPHQTVHLHPPSAAHVPAAVVAASPPLVLRI